MTTGTAFWWMASGGLGIQLSPKHVPPEWPDGAQQQRVHLDLHVDDLRAAHEKAISLGARLLQATDDLDADESHQVYADPAGHPFCLGVHRRVDDWLKQRVARE